MCGYPLRKSQKSDEMEAVCGASESVSNILFGSPGAVPWSPLCRRLPSCLVLVPGTCDELLFLSYCGAPQVVAAAVVLLAGTHRGSLAGDLPFEQCAVQNGAGLACLGCVGGHVTVDSCGGSHSWVKTVLQCRMRDELEAWQERASPRVVAALRGEGLDQFTERQDRFCGLSAFLGLDQSERLVGMQSCGRKR